MLAPIPALVFHTLTHHTGTQCARIMGGVEKQELERDFYQWVLGCLMKNIEKYKDGILIQLYNGEVKWLVPFLSHVITDWPEGQQMCGMKQGATSSQRYNNL